ncbi:MAG: Rne/Rng family ribonuclease [Desulfovibrio sp.]|nr:Rne/Rng family ribonuclease [Desulfovibrio sp.]
MGSTKAGAAKKTEASKDAKTVEMDEAAEADSVKADSVRNTAGDKKNASQRKNTAAKMPTATKKDEAPSGKRRMFVSVLPGEQVEVALAEDGIVQEYYLDMLHQRKIKGNIYKGLVQNIDTNLQAAFVNFGIGKNGFLQIDEVHPEYWQAHHEPAKGKKFPPIQKALKIGQEVLVQVVKEPTGNKGAFLTTWLSLAGRFLVLTPGQEQTGVSRKVEDGEERDRLREMVDDLDPGIGLGVIVRTVSAGATKTTLKSDLQYLKRVWRDIRKKGTEATAPTLVYQEPGLSERAVRDYLTDDVVEIWLDNDEIAERVRETVSLLFPRRKNLIRLHTDGRVPLWERFNLRRQLDQIYSREVALPSGGRLVFDQTEALMAVDVNSGKISGKANFEAMAHKTNLEAAETVPRQLKLRDVGGQVVIDFIEMREKKHVQEVEKTLRQAMKNDRARHDVGRMSAFGMLEMVRQRTGSSALAITMEPCPSCGGTGQRRNLEWQALQALGDMRRLLRAENNSHCRYETRQDVALYLLNHKRDSLRELEQEYGKCLEIAVRL